MFRSRVQLKASARCLRVASVALLELVVSGCVHLEQELRIHPDGSASFLYHYSVAEENMNGLAAGQAAIEAWQGVRSAADDPKELHWFFSRRAVERQFRGAGLQLQRHTCFTKGGRRHVEISVFVERLDEALATGRFGPLAVTTTADGNLRLQAQLAQDLERRPLSAAQMERVRAVCADLRLTLTIEVPTEIVSTTAPKVQGKTATWLFDPATDTAFIEAPPAIEVVFKHDTLKWRGKR